MKATIIFLLIISLSFSVSGQERLGSCYYTQSYYGFSGLSFIPNSQIFPASTFGFSYFSEPSHGSNLSLLPYSLNLIYGFKGSQIEVTITNTPFYSSERLYGGVAVDHGIPDYDIIIPVYPTVKYQIMPMSDSNFQVGMAIGFALPYGAYYAADKQVDLSIFDMTILTGVATKLSTYHVFTGITFTFGNHLSRIQRDFNLEMLVEAAWGGSLKELDKKEEAFISLSFRHAWTSSLFIKTYIRYDNQPLTKDGSVFHVGPTMLMGVGLDYHLL